VARGLRAAGVRTDTSYGRRTAGGRRGLPDRRQRPRWVRRGAQRLSRRAFYACLEGLEATPLRSGLAPPIGHKPHDSGREPAVGAQSADLGCRAAGGCAPTAATGGVRGAAVAFRPADAATSVDEATPLRAGPRRLGTNRTLPAENLQLVTNPQAPVPGRGWLRADGSYGRGPPGPRSLPGPPTAPPRGNRCGAQRQAPHRPRRLGTTRTTPAGIHAVRAQSRGRLPRHALHKGRRRARALRSGCIETGAERLPHPPGPRARNAFLNHQQTARSRRRRGCVPRGAPSRPDNARSRQTGAPRSAPARRP
jgi:hypothetical protein